MTRINNRMNSVAINLEPDELECELLRHAPKNRSDGGVYAITEKARDAILNRKPLKVIVLTADIRGSTRIMLNSIDLLEYAETIDDFVSDFRTVLSHQQGWFDKFTGDGFICYWLVDEDHTEHCETVLSFAVTVMQIFRKFYMPTLCGNLPFQPTGVGLSIGIDVGECLVTRIAGDLTVIGHAVVGSVRMCDAARQPFQVLLHSDAARHMSQRGQKMKGRATDEVTYTAAPATVGTKDCPDGVAVVEIRFASNGQDVFPESLLPKLSTQARRARSR